MYILYYSVLQLHYTIKCVQCDHWMDFSTSLDQKWYYWIGGFIRQDKSLHVEIHFYLSQLMNWNTLHICKVSSVPGISSQKLIMVSQLPIPISKWFMSTLTLADYYIIKTVYQLLQLIVVITVCCVLTVFNGQLYIWPLSAGVIVGWAGSSIRELE